MTPSFHITAFLLGCCFLVLLACLELPTIHVRAFQTTTIHNHILPQRHSTQFQPSWKPLGILASKQHPEDDEEKTKEEEQEKPAGAFFNAVPETPPDNNDDNHISKNDNDNNKDQVDKSLEQLLQQRNQPSRASQPSTINGVPTSQAGIGFALNNKNNKNKQNDKSQKQAPPTVKQISFSNQKKSSTYIGIGPPDTTTTNDDEDDRLAKRRALNDVTKPQTDDQGYTLYADETTGQTSRVFEALVDYPCEFPMKIVGANEGTFVADMLQVVADSCQVPNVADIRHSTRTMGKWISVTVHAPVQNAQMLYQLYEHVDRDPRVKFKF